MRDWGSYPVELSPLAPTPGQACSSCGTYTAEGEPVQRGQGLQLYAIKAGPNSQYTIAWCRLCAKKVALFLLQTTIEGEE